MGALVSPGGGDWEKSIEVPCIILSESTFYSDPILLSSQPALDIHHLQEIGWLEYLSFPLEHPSSFDLKTSSPSHLLTSFIYSVSPSPCPCSVKRTPLTTSRTRPSSQSPNPHPTKTNPPTPTHFPPTSTSLDLISSNGKPKTRMGITLSCCTCGLCSWIRGLAFMGCIGWRGEGRSVGQAVRRLTVPRPSTGR